MSPREGDTFLGQSGLQPDNDGVKPLWQVPPPSRRRRRRRLQDPGSTHEPQNSTTAKAVARWLFHLGSKKRHDKKPQKTLKTSSSSSDLSRTSHSSHGSTSSGIYDLTPTKLNASVQPEVLGNQAKRYTAELADATSEKRGRVETQADLAANDDSDDFFSSDNYDDDDNSGSQRQNFQSQKQTTDQPSRVQPKVFIKATEEKDSTRARRAYTVIFGRGEDKKERPTVSKENAKDAPRTEDKNITTAKEGKSQSLFLVQDHGTPSLLPPMSFLNFHGFNRSLSVIDEGDEDHDDDTDFESSDFSTQHSNREQPQTGERYELNEDLVTEPIFVPTSTKIWTGWNNDSLESDEEEEELDSNYSLEFPSRLSLNSSTNKAGDFLHGLFQNPSLDNLHASDGESISSGEITSSSDVEDMGSHSNLVPSQTQIEETPEPQYREQEFSSSLPLSFRLLERMFFLPGSAAATFSQARNHNDSNVPSLLHNGQGRESQDHSSPLLHESATDHIGSKNDSLFLDKRSQGDDDSSSSGDDDDSTNLLVPPFAEEMQECLQKQSAQEKIVEKRLEQIQHDFARIVGRDPDTEQCLTAASYCWNQVLAMLDYNGVDDPYFAPLWSKFQDWVYTTVGEIYFEESNARASAVKPLFIDASGVPFVFENTRKCGIVHLSGSGNRRSIQVRQDSTPRDMALVIQWIDNFLADFVKAQKYYHQKRRERAAGDEYFEPLPSVLVDPFREWRRYQERLFQHFLKRGVRQEMQNLFKRCKELESLDDIRHENETNYLVSGFPESVEFMFEQQLAAARTFLPSRYTPQVLAACNQELSVYVGELILHVGQTWSDTRTMKFCCIINDAYRLSERCEDRNEKYLQDSDCHDEVKELTTFCQDGERLVADLTQLAMHACALLADRMVHDLCSPGNPILSSVGDMKWEVDKTHSVISSTVLTFQDFFRDLEVWLVEFFFPRVLRGCFDFLLQAYLENFFANTMTNGLKNPSTAAENLIHDYSQLKTFFTTDDVVVRYEGVAGYYKGSQIVSRLDILVSMARLVDPGISPPSLVDDIQKIYECFGGSNEVARPVVLHLAGLRKYHNSSEAIEWFVALGTAKRNLEDKSLSLKSSRSMNDRFRKYHIPDLRNSKYVRQFQMPKEDPRMPTLAKKELMSLRKLVQPKSWFGF